MESLVAKIDKISQDISFMKGEQSEYLPNIKAMLKNHEERIVAQEKSSENIKTKVGFAGAISGGIMSILVAYIISKFH